MRLMDWPSLGRAEQTRWSRWKSKLFLLISFRENIFEITTLCQAMEERQLLGGQEEASPRSHRITHGRFVGCCATLHMARGWAGWAEHPGTSMGKGPGRADKSKVGLTFLNLVFMDLNTVEELDPGRDWGRGLKWHMNYNICGSTEPGGESEASWLVP